MSFNTTIDRLHTLLTESFKKSPEYIERYKDASPVTWSWVAIQMAQLMNIYPTGLTATIALSELETTWERRCLSLINHKFDKIANLYEFEYSNRVLFLQCRLNQLDYKHGTIWLASLRDASQREMDLYLLPKCSDWINNKLSPLMKDFSKDRKIRFVCIRQINNLLLSHYYDSTLRRSDQVLCCPPTHECLWELEPRDGPWIKDVFRDTFATIIQPQSMAISSMAKVKRHKLWVKVTHVEQLQDDKEYNLKPGNQFVSKNIQEKQIRKDIYVVDMSGDTEPALLSLYDEQAYLTRLIQRGDYLGIFDPIIAYRRTESQATRADIVLECGPETMLFIMSSNDAVEASLAKAQPISNESSTAAVTEKIQETYSDNTTSRESVTASLTPEFDFWHPQKSVISPIKKPPIMERDDEGLMDCLAYVPRLMINDLEPNMVNITISGQVIAKANNNPFISEGKRLDRFAMRIEDESGKMDVTLWEQSAAHAKTISIGQRILLTGLSTSIQQKSVKGKSTWYINGSTVCGTTVFNLSTCSCLLASNDFVQLTPLHMIKGDGQWETEATIVGWKVHTGDLYQPIIYSHQLALNCYNNNAAIDLSDCLIAQAHCECLQMIEDGDYCSYCDTEVAESGKMFAFRSRKNQLFSDKTTTKKGWIEWRLDNGEGMLYAKGCENILLDCDAGQFRNMYFETQVRLLDSVIGSQCVCSISSVGSNGYSLDSLTLDGRYYSKCTEMLQQLSTT